MAQLPQKYDVTGDVQILLAEIIKTKLQPFYFQKMSPSVYQQVGYRYVIITVYLLAALVNQISANTFSATTTLVEKIFNIPSTLVTLNYLFFPIAHFLFAVPVNWALTKMGIRFSYYLAAVVMIAGVWLRISLSEGDPYLCLLGSLLSGGSGLILLSSGSKITLNWFRSDHITVITYLCVLCNMISLTFGLILPGFFLSSTSNQDDYLSFLRLEAIIITIPFILLAIFIRQKPDIAPSRAADAEHTNNKQKKYSHTMKLLFKNKNYLKMTATMSLTFGSIVAYLSIINQCLTGMGYAEPTHILSTVVIVLLISGIVGNVLFSLAVKKTKKFKIFSIIMNFGCFIGFMILSIGFYYKLSQVWQLVVISFLFGMCYAAIPSFFVVYGSQIAFPVDQASIAGYLISISQTVGFLIGLILLPFVRKTRQNSMILFMVIGGLILIGAIITGTIEQDLRKDKYEQGLLKDDYGSLILENDKLAKDETS